MILTKVVIGAVMLLAKSGYDLCKDDYIFSKNFDANKFLEEFDDKLHVKSISYIEPEFSNCYQIKPYFDKLAEYLTEEELTLATNNIKSLKIKKGLFNLVYSGTYNSKKNRIIYYKRKSIGHELLHMASAYYDKENKVDLCGFRTIKDGRLVGIGLNEGFTELLASRIFNEDGKPHSYLGLVSICEMLELFFDDPGDLRKLYFSNGLSGFIRQMEKYMTTEEAFNLIFEMDNLADSNLARETSIKSFLYRKFKGHCSDSEKLEKMESLIATDKRNKNVTNIKSKNSIESISNKKYLKRQFKKDIAIYATAIGLVASLGAGGVCAIDYSRSLNETGAFISTSINDYNFYKTANFSNYQMIRINNSTLTGKDIFDYLVVKGFSYCKLLGSYYTISGGDITFDTYKVKINTANGDSYIDYISEVTLPHGVNFFETDNLDNMEIIEKIYTVTYSTKPFEDIIDSDFNIAHAQSDETDNPMKLVK